jgi:diacylglycerol kinase family enzyme
MIERYEVKRVDVDSTDGFAYHVDGELLHTAAPPAGGGQQRHPRVSVSVVPEALRFLVPQRFYRLFHPFDYDTTFE